MNFYRLFRRKLRSARTLSRSDWCIFFQAWGLLPAIDVGLRLLPFLRVQRMLAGGWKRPDCPNPDKVPDTIQYLARLVLMAERNHLFSMGCLRRALALQWLLQRRGIQTELCIGVQRDDGEFSAHAWLEYQGNPIGETYDVEARFAQLKVIDTAQ